jgi:hypothetical protein
MDITKCTGDGCALKEICKRYTAEANPYRQSFVDPPFKIEDNVLTCHMYLGESNEAILDQLLEITKKKS